MSYLSTLITCLRYLSRTYAYVRIVTAITYAMHINTHENKLLHVREIVCGRLCVCVCARARFRTSTKSLHA